MRLEYHSVANIFPVMEQGEFAALVADVATHGLREPIVVYHGEIIDGRHRYRACRELGIEPIVVEWDGFGTLVDAVVSLNLRRRHLNESQRAMVAARLSQLGVDVEGAPVGIPTVSQGAAAGMLGVSRDQVNLAARLDRHGSPQLLEAVESGDVAVSTAAELARLPHAEQAELVARGPKEILAAAKAIKAEDRQARRNQRTDDHRAIAAGNRELDFGDRRFALVSADPPWRFDNNGPDLHGAAENHYPTMSVEEIMAMPVPRLLAANAALLLWVPNAMHKEGIAVLEAWGFELKTNFVWVKEGSPGTGWYTFGDHELMLVGVRGSAIPARRYSSVIQAPRGRHSEKPDVVWEMAAGMYPGAMHGAALELFCRGDAYPGWTPWGNQAEPLTDAAA